MQKFARAGNQELIQILLDKGVDIDHRRDGWSYNTALHVAAEEGQFEMAEFLVGKGTDVMAQNEELETPLVRAFSRGHARGYEISLFLIEAMGNAGGDLNIRNKMGQTALHNIIHHRDNSELPHVVSALIENGTDVFSEGSYGNWPLESAIGSGQEVVSRLLINTMLAKQDAIDNKESMWSDADRLEKAIGRKLRSVAPRLVALGAELIGPESTALDAAIFHGGTPILDTLLERGLKTWPYTRMQRDMWWTIDNNGLDMERLKMICDLKKLGKINIDLSDLKWNRSTLHHIARHLRETQGGVEAARMLLDAGASVKVNRKCLTIPLCIWLWLVSEEPPRADRYRLSRCSLMLL